MGDVVNLNRFRKDRARETEERRAAANRLRFGQRKDERERTKRESQKAEKDLDNKRVD
ncbi:MAG TPA: DUF4169 family protein [Stellaceae bacterium]|nr:DUF4169 family protein [Stellaceae bacterium]